MKFLGPLGASLQFLTRLPLSHLTTTAEDRGKSGYWYGVVGLGIGGVLAGGEHLLRGVLPLGPRLICVLMANIALTGGLHWDGLADTVDGFGAGRHRERALAIMSDSRIGTFGALALIGILALQFSLLEPLNGPEVGRALFMAPAWGRAAMVCSAAVSVPAKSDGLGGAFLRSVRPLQGMAAVIPVVAVALWLHTRTGLAVGVATFMLSGALAAIFRRRLGGQTGDTLGCLNQLVETLTYGLTLVLR